MKPYFSTSAGILYTYNSGKTNFDIGVSAFHLNKPKQTFFDDEKQFLAPRYVVHANIESFLSEQVIFNANGVYQKQAGSSYFSIGGALGYYLPSYEKDLIVNAGLWYWSNNAIIPYFGFCYGNAQIGLTYDITISKLKEAPKKAHTFELCLILRGNGGKSNGVIPSPWK
jgi:type IX secretion system PorP/SprF family membrane protein